MNDIIKFLISFSVVFVFSILDNFTDYSNRLWFGGIMTMLWMIYLNQKESHEGLK